jgi:RecA/RadA recombinase
MKLIYHYFLINSTNLLKKYGTIIIKINNLSMKISGKNN